jgi:hypothetical protein
MLLFGGPPLGGSQRGVKGSALKARRGRERGGEGRKKRRGKNQEQGRKKKASKGKRHVSKPQLSSGIGQLNLSVVV